MDGTDVNHSARSSDCSLLVTADDFGKVKLYNYPVCQPRVRNYHYLHTYLLKFIFFQSLCHVMSGHSSHVTHVEFLQEDSRIVSTGGKDMSVMQWRLS